MNDRDEYEVLVVKYGTRSTVRSDVFLNYGVYREPNGPIEMDYFCWIARNSSRTVVFDTGFSPAGGAARGRTTLIDPRDAFDAVHYYEECDKNMPFVSAANLIDMYAGFGKVRAMVADGSAAHVVSGHDPATLDRFTRVDGPPGAEVAIIGKLGS